MKLKTFTLLTLLTVLLGVTACSQEDTSTPTATAGQPMSGSTEVSATPSPGLTESSAQVQDKTVMLTPVATQPEPAPPAYWPTKAWLTSTPEEQGMDSETLLAMLEGVQRYDPGIGSILVVRNGHLVLKAYYPGFATDITQNIQSCTKSIMSTLIGIAIDQGHIESVEQPVLDFFPGRTFANMDADKQSITIQDLLTMRPGLECIINDREVTLEKMQDSSDWVQYFLDLPMQAEPGTHWTYCSPASYVLAVILQQATGMSALEFAQENLFDPLGIDQVMWASGPQGYNTGWGNIHLRPRDMAKFGYLYLNEGQWDGEQIVPAHWIAQATRSQVEAANYGLGYGYQWWVDEDSHYYLAMGHYGQLVVVVPDLDMVVVLTARIPDKVVYNPLSLVDDYILPAVVSETALPENPDATKLVLEHLANLVQPSTPQPVPPLPDIAHQVSGQTFTCPDDKRGRMFSFAFSAGDDVALQFIEFANDDDPVIENHIGLDGVYRYSLDEGDGNEHLFHNWLKGFWESDNEFVITGLSRYDHPYEGFPRSFWCSYTFENDQVAYACGMENEYPQGRVFVQTCIAQYPTATATPTEPAPTLTPRPGAEEIRFQSDHFALVGDLRLPAPEGKHPAIIMVHGDGGINRTDSRKYLPIMERFLRAGYAVFSWDKPGTGASTGEFIDGAWIITDRASILVDAVEFLKTHPAIDPARIGVWGISQAGAVMPMALTMTDDIAFMIVVSGPGVDSIDQTAYLIGQQLLCRGYSGEDAKLAERSYAGVCKATTYQEYLENHTNLIPFSHVASFVGTSIIPEQDWSPWDRNVDAFFNPIAVIEQTTIPVLAFFGEKDTQVDPVQGAQAYQEALQEAGNQNFRVELIPGVAHGMDLAETGCMDEHRRTVYAPEYLDLMEAWLVQLANPQAPLSGGDGGEIAFFSDRDGNQEIYVMNADGSDQRNLTNHPASDDAPHWSPDGSQIAFSSDRGGNYDVYVMDAGGANPRQLTNHPSVDVGPVWSPDGARIAFVSLRDGNAEIYVVNADGDNLQRLTRTETDEFEFDWSPKGTQIVFAASEGDYTNVYVMNADGSERRPLTDTGAHDFYPRWSPDAGRIAFLSTRDGSLEEIYVMDSDGHNPRRLTKNDAFDGAPSWSPDGTQLVFASARDGNAEIYVMDSDGANVRRLTDNGAADRKPAWRPVVQATTSVPLLHAIPVDTADKVELLSTLSGHDDRVNDLFFSGDGTLLASGGYDNQIYLWGIPH